MIFSGEFEHKLDKQGRLNIPSRYRTFFLKGIVLTRGYDQCIVAYTVEMMQNLAKDISKMPNTSSYTRKLARLTFSNAYTLDVDSNGRILVPSVLRNYANISNKCMMVGTGDLLELWDPQLWEIEKTNINKNSEKITEFLSNQKFVLEEEN